MLLVMPRDTLQNSKQMRPWGCGLGVSISFLIWPCQSSYSLLPRLAIYGLQGQVWPPKPLTSTGWIHASAAFGGREALAAGTFDVPPWG